MSKPVRKPALQRPHHPADDLPARPVKAPAAAAADKTSTVPAPSSSPPTSEEEEKYTVQSNMRMKASTRFLLEDAVSVLQFQTRDRSHSMQSLVDAAVLEYIDRHGLRR